ncbi:Peptide methionine sulfoxide reductase MsrB [Fasciolopsis buskii]|uniref:Peptide-methionine (R)-S-oxide reductase n=1 Tax=Fasciolopsis buskii TaxID=27845 RepID=A0A8E0S007_9TREM|nr:Peptide methionine sulfoxide reductase MsrB [Fasciolopsis buski]KAA0192518.1 Peptide methionine sulfoxide reductase MsrB [Fasciolopsis buski]
MNLLHIIKQSEKLSPTIQSLLNSSGPSSPQRSTNVSVCSRESMKDRLTDLQYKVTQEKYTEKPFSGPYVNDFTPGVYHCVVCETELFGSNSKFACNAGWPAFSEPMKDRIAYNLDPSTGELRVEVACKRCGAHLGHVFDDGPKPAGLRYCINSAALVHQSSRNDCQDSCVLNDTC